MSAVGYINISLELWGCVISFVVALCLLMGNGARGRRNRVFLYILLCNAALLLCDASSWLLKGRTGPFSWWGVRISNFLVFALGYVLLLLFTKYITCYLAEHTQVSKIPLALVRWLCLASFALVILTQFNHLFYLIDEQNLYHRQSWFWLSQVAGICGMCINAGLLIRYRKTISRMERAALWSYIALPVLGMSVQIFIYGVALLNLANTVSILVIFLVIQVEQGIRAKEQELEVSESRTAIMLSQIQPHFLYNALSSIDQLCFDDPMQAHQAILMFSKYLRGNLDSLSQKELVPFEQELEHTRQYLALEQLRFHERLRVDYDIRCGGFLVPVLTVQPIVENAVRYGVTRRVEGGMVAIRTEDEPDCWKIIVQDDGVGFAPEALPADGRSHTGIANVRTRLETMCGGSLLIASSSGEGTRATIVIPKRTGRRAQDGPVKN